MPSNHDELMRRIHQDELEDQAAHQSKMTPTDYARARRMQAQLVYYYIRTGKIKDETCICGRRVIDIKDADTFFRAKDKAKKGS
jgi:hypothetical protein